MNIKELYSRIGKYEDISNKANNMYKSILEEGIDFEDLEKMRYKELKEFSIKTNYFLNKENKEKLDNLLIQKKTIEYPEWSNGVYYYPELKEIGWLSTKEQRRIDQLIGGEYFSSKLVERLDKKVLEFLVNKKILEKVYIFYDGIYDEKYVTEEVFLEYKKYWDKIKAGVEINDDEFYDKYDEGVLTLFFEENCLEISSEEEFKEKAKITYKRIKDPDLSLENL